MKSEKEQIKINISKEGKMFVAVVKWNDGREMATQGKNYPELYENIYDLMKIKLEDI